VRTPWQRWSVATVGNGRGRESLQGEAGIEAGTETRDGEACEANLQTRSCGDMGSGDRVFSRGFSVQSAVSILVLHREP
jgi:hypothetical protein